MSSVFYNNYSFKVKNDRLKENVSTYYYLQVKSYAILIEFYNMITVISKYTEIYSFFLQCGGSGSQFLISISYLIQLYYVQELLSNFLWPIAI